VADGAKAAPFACPPVGVDSGLAEVIETWPTLAVLIKAAILAMVHASKGT
jgi:hypothetical protein